MACAICDVRRPKRFCPGVSGDICTICCGTEREVTVSCPLDCPFLQDSRQHEKPPDVRPEDIPNGDIRVSEEFLQEKVPLLTFAATSLAGIALGTPGALDRDVREALDSLIRTYRTLESGLVYESLPTNPLAANIHRHLHAAIAEFRQQEQQAAGMSKTRDADVLGVLAFLQRVEYMRNNGKARGRAFIDFLRRQFGERQPDEAAPERSPLIVP